MEMKVLKHQMVVFSWKDDLCNKKTKPDLVKLFIAYLGIPFDCPVKSSMIHCYNGDKILTFSESTKRLLSLFVDETGVILRMSITHNNGKSCFQVENRVYKLREWIELILEKLWKAMKNDFYDYDWTSMIGKWYDSI